MAHRKFKNIQRKNKEEKRQKRTQVIISVFFVGLMVFSVLGIYASNKQNSASNELKYGEYDFTLIEEIPDQFALSLFLNDEEKIFYALPQDTFRIPVTGNLTAAIGDVQYLALASNPGPRLAPLIDLMRFDFDRYGHVLVAGVPLTIETEQDNNDQKLIVLSDSGVNCLNATTQVPVITFIESTNTTQIDVIGSCVQIQSQPNDLFLVRDRLLYSLLKIIDE